jgi:hypothetical protein
VREPVRERAVVRQQERAGRVGVEPSDGDDPRLVPDEVDDGLPSPRIPSRLMFFPVLPSEVTALT